MKIYYFSNINWETRFQLDELKLTNTITHVANGTCVDDLVVAVYFVNNSKWNGGAAYTRNWIQSKQFNKARGRWQFTKAFPVPLNIPDSFKLIRLQFDLNHLKYPLSQIDIYGWKINSSSFIDHLAFLFAHELHHFRRYHLGFHHREGENSANKWAIDYTRQLNYRVNGEKLKKQPRKKIISRFSKSTKFFDKYQKFRTLSSGDQIKIKHDPSGRYENASASVVRPIRNNSRRIVIKTPDGKQWRWPMEWVALVK